MTLKTERRVAWLWRNLTDLHIHKYKPTRVHRWSEHVRPSVRDASDGRRGRYRICLREGREHAEEFAKLEIKFFVIFLNFRFELEFYRAGTSLLVVVHTYYPLRPSLKALRPRLPKSRGEC